MRLYDIKISYIWLRELYRRHKITFKYSDNHTIIKLRRKVEIQNEQRDFVRKAEEYIRCGKRLYYVDQTSFHLW
jgi:hypothetical protein